MGEKTISFRCFDTCRYTLVFPAFFLDRPKATLVKVFKWLFQFDWYAENQEAIEFFDREIPVFAKNAEAIGQKQIDGAEKTWQECMSVCDHNTRRVKEAKANYERTKKQVQKEIKRAKVIYEVYQNAKNQ